MIYLITGVPGSGKTLYAVSNLIQKLAAEKIKQKDGVEIKRRLLVDGIRDLILPHEMMAPGADRGDGQWESADGDGIWNWPTWCKPGDLIVVDEVQRWWRPRGNGVKPPLMISALETHRHRGVDFVIITQNPMLMDQNVRRLVGRHQNVRRLFGMAKAMIYDWDTCQTTIKGSTASKSIWSYPKDAYKLYASSELHTKQRQSFPVWLLLPVLALVAAVFVGPRAYSTLSNAMSGKGVTTAAAGAVLVVPAVSQAGGVAPMVASSAPVPSVVAAAPFAVPAIAGCGRVADLCKCFDKDGVRVDVPAAVCTDRMVVTSPQQNVLALLDVKEVNAPTADHLRGEHDSKLLALMQANQKRLTATK